MPEKKTRKTARPGTAERPVDRGARQESGGWDAPLPEPKVVREARFEFRSTRDQKAIIEHAAMLRGMTMADYVRATVLEKAAQDVQSMHVTVVSIRDWERFIEILDNPPLPNEALKQAYRDYLSSDVKSAG